VHYSSVLSGTALLLGPLAGTTAVWADDPIFPYIPSNPNNDPDYYDITNPQYGGSTSASAATNAAAINAALNACSTAGGGTVVIPAGIFQCAPMSLNGLSNVNLQVDGTLQAPDMADFGSNPAGSYYIYWKYAYNDMLSGSGTIDGNGASWSGSSSKPKFINFSNGQVVAVENLHVQNTPKEGFTFSGSQTADVTFDGVTVFNPSNSPNTDGIDPNGNNILIENCNVSTGDDDIALKCSPSNVQNGCNNIRITNCTFGYGHGLSIGGQTNMGLTNMTVTNCTFTNTNYGFRLKAGKGNGGVVKNVTFSNCTMTNVSTAIVINSWYDSGDHYGHNEWPPNGFLHGLANPKDPSVTVDEVNNTDAYPFFDNISFSNINATCAGNYNVAVIYGLNSTPADSTDQPPRNIDSISFSNVNLIGDPSGSWGADIYYASNLDLSGLNVTATNSPNFEEYGDTFVPEPATASVALLGWAGLLLCRQRRKPAHAPVPLSSHTASG